MDEGGDFLAAPGSSTNQESHDGNKNGKMIGNEKLMVSLSDVSLYSIIVHILNITQLTKHSFFSICIMRPDRLKSCFMHE